jgi:UDP-glucuronate 4-epimerase
MGVLVTGCAGFIGSHLTESLLADGHTVRGIDCFNDNYGRRDKIRNLRRAMNWDEFEFIPIDLARGNLHDLVADADTVFHLAAEPGVRASWGDRFELYVRNNVLATQHLLEAAKEWPEKKFVHASSSSIYGEAESLPTPESTSPRPFSPYGVTKLDAENLCRLYHAHYGVRTVSLRYFSVFGPRQRPDMAFNMFCRAALEGRPITIFGDGRQTRDFTFVSDVVAATRAAAVADVPGNTYNIGGGTRASLSDALDLIAQLVGRSLKTRFVERGRGDVKDTAADVSLAQRDLAYRATVGLDDGLREEFDWIVETSQEIDAAV